jgi:hypothetical protein
MKKIILPFILLIVGLAAGYYIGKDAGKNLIGDETTFKNKTIQERHEKSLKMIGSRNSRPIDPDLARALIKEYNLLNRGSINPILTSKGDTLRGFYIEKNPFIEIFKNKKYVGISFYLAKSHDMTGINKNYYSLVFMGAEKIPGKINSADSTIVNGGPYYDYVDPCPKACGDF